MYNYVPNTRKLKHNTTTLRKFYHCQAGLQAAASPRLWGQRVAAGGRAAWSAAPLLSARALAGAQM